MQDDFQYDLNVTNVKFVMSPAQPSATPRVFKLGLSVMVRAEIILDDQSNYHPTKPTKKQTTKRKKISNKKHQKQYNFIFGKTASAKYVNHAR